MKLNKLAVFALSGLLLAGTAMAQEEAQENDRPAWLPSLELSIDRTSRYMSEGNVGNPDPIDTISLTAEWSITDNFAFHIGGVSIIDETNACDHDNNVEEWDWSAGVTFALPGGIEVTLDYIYYNYPWDEHKHNVDTKEYELDVTATEVFLSPGIVFVHDFENDVIKANVNVTYEQELSFISEKLGFECPVELWVGNHQYTGSTSHTAVYSVCVQPTLNFAITDNLSIGTYLQMGWALDSRVRRDWKKDENNCAFNICWGLNLTATF